MTDIQMTTTNTTQTTPASRRPRLGRAALGLLGAGALAFTSMGAASAADDPIVTQEWADAAIEAAQNSSDPEAAQSCADAILDHRDLGLVAEHMPEGPTSVSREVSASDNENQANSGVECIFNAEESKGGPVGGATVSVEYIADTEEVKQLKADPEGYFTPSPQERGNPEFTTVDKDGVTTVTQTADTFPDVPFTASIAYPENKGQNGPDVAVVVKAGAFNADSVPFEDLELADEISSGEHSERLAVLQSDSHAVWGPNWDNLPADEDRADS